MTIKELEERSGLERATIRFYEKEGLLSPKRLDNGYRDYSEAELELLLRIRLLRDIHLPLDEIRALETGTDFPASLSIGVDAVGKTPAQTVEYADAALDLAMGRGGDQAVIKRNLKIEYFGGKLAAVE